MIAVCFLLSIALATAQETQRYAWNGEVRLVEGSTTNPGYETSAAALDSALAAIDVDLQLDRDFDLALRKLGGLQARASRVQEFAGQGDLLVRVALLRSQVLNTRGKRDEARQALDALLPRKAQVEDELGSLFTCVPAPKRLFDLEEGLLKDPRLVAARSGLDTAARTRADAQEPVDLESILENALINGDTSVAVEIGQRAAPVLERMLEKALDEYPADHDYDALTALILVSGSRAVAFISQHLSHPGFYWKKRVLRSMRETGVLAAPRSWQFPGPRDVYTSEPPRLLEPGWSDILAHYALDPDVGAEALDRAAYLALYDALSPALQQALIAGWQSQVPEIFEQVRRIAADARGQPSMVTVLEAGLDHRLPDVRERCAKGLVWYERSHGLRRAVGHADAIVRLALANSLGDREFDAPKYSWSDRLQFTLRNQELEPVEDGKDAALFDRLLVDASEDVRLAAVRSLDTRSDVRPALQTMLSLAADPSAEVRAQTVNLLRFVEDQAPEVLAKLALDEQASVLERVDQYLLSSAAYGHVADVIPYRDAIFARLTRADRPLRGDPSMRNTLLAIAYSDRAALLAPIVEVALERDDDKLLWEAIGYAPDQQAQQTGEAFEALAPELLARALVRAYRQGDFMGDQFEEDVGPLAPAMLLVVRDAGVEREVRVAAASYLARSTRPGDQEAVWALLRSPEWNETPPNRQERDYLVSVGNLRVSAGELARFLADPSRNAEMKLSLTRNLGKDTLEDRSLALEVIRHIDPHRNDTTVCHAVHGLSGPLPEDDAERVRALVFETNDRVGLEAIEYFGRLREPRYFSWLVEWLNVDGLGAEYTRDVHLTAARAIAGYLNDEAAEALLAAAGRTTDDKQLATLFAGLDKIRDYQDQVARWRTRQAGSEARESAILKLVPMLEDPVAEVRAQAALGLATLGAVEQLPKVVLMLKDPETEVRAAAKQALESLHRQEEARRQAQPQSEVKQDE